MYFEDLAKLPVVHLYAGDIPNKPEYRTRNIVGLSFTQNDAWHIRHDIVHCHPLPDESVDSYQVEDVFEHIPYEKLEYVVADIHRILKKGGLFRLSVPDYRCDILYERSEKDHDGNIVFDPGGGGRYQRQQGRFGKTTVVDGGHVWFPVVESVKQLLRDIPFTSVEFLQYFDERSVPHIAPIDYSKGYIQRTPDHDVRVAKSFRPMSIVVDCVK